MEGLLSGAGDAFLIGQTLFGGSGGGGQTPLGGSGGGGQAPLGGSGGGGFGGGLGAGESAGSGYTLGIPNKWDCQSSSQEEGFQSTYQKEASANLEPDTSEGKNR